MMHIAILAAFVTALIAMRLDLKYTRLLRQRHRELLETIRQDLADEWGKGEPR